MKQKIVFILTASLILLGSSFVYAQQNNGPENLSLYGGKTGDVPFPHRQHQNALKQDCNICHDVFAQSSGAIQEMISQKKLKAKQVMNKQCVACHKEKKKEGVKTGPTSCKKCHVKK